MPSAPSPRLPFPRAPPFRPPAIRENGALDNRDASVIDLNSSSLAALRAARRDLLKSIVRFPIYEYRPPPDCRAREGRRGGGGGRLATGPAVYLVARMKTRVARAPRSLP